MSIALYSYILMLIKYHKKNECSTILKEIIVIAHESLFLLDNCSSKMDFFVLI